MSGQDLQNFPIDSKEPSASANGQAEPADSFDLSLDLDDILRATCKAAVDLFKVDHSGLMVFDSKLEVGRVIAEYPPIGTQGSVVPLRGVPAEEKLVTFQLPILVPDVSLDSSFRPVREILRGHDIKSVLVVPLKSKGSLIGSLGLDMIGQPREFTSDEIERTRIFAQQAAAVIDLYKQKHFKAGQLDAIESTAVTFTSYEDLRSELDKITSQAVQLVGGTDGGVSQFNPQHGELTVISYYKFPKLIGTRISLWEGLAGKVIRKDLPFEAVTDYSNYSESAPVLAETKHFGAVLMINLKWQGHCVGVLYINAEVGRVFPAELPPALVLLASSAAMAIANSHLSHDAEIAREHISSSYEIVNALSSDPNSEQVLRDIANHSIEAANAAQVRLMIFDDDGKQIGFTTTRGVTQVESGNPAAPCEITLGVLKTGRAYCNPNVEKGTLAPSLVGQDIKAAMCLPLFFKSGRRGVIWIEYLEPHKFSKADLQLLENYLKQAAIAYDNTRKLETMEPLRQVIENLASATTSKDVMERIVTSARELFDADYAALWPYPETGADLVLPVKEVVIAGIDEALREEMLDEALPIGEITNLVMRERWLPVPEIRKTAHSLLPEISFRLLKRLRATSFEGLGLVVGTEKLAVLYLVHREHRVFEDEETRMALTFATHAARALKKAKLVDHAAKGQMLAAEISALAALVDLEKTLNRIVASVRLTQQCDAVTLFVYDESTDQFLPLTAMFGVGSVKLLPETTSLPRESILFKVVKRDSPLCVPRVADNELFANLPFVEREGIGAVCAIPLITDGHRVGVIFINYHGPHDFTSEELAPIQPIVNEAAKAILSHLRYKEQNDPATVSKALRGAKSLDDYLEFAVDNAADSLRADFVAIVLAEADGTLRIAKWRAWTEEDVAEYEYENENYQGADENQTRFTIERGEAVIVQDYSQKTPFRVPAIVKSKNIKCGISVPMFSGDKVVGAILAHFLDARPVLDAHARTLSLIANFTAISLQHHQAVKRLKDVKTAAEEISKIKLDTELKEVFDKVVKHTVEGLPHAFLATIQTYHESRNVLRFESVFPDKKKIALNSEIGTERVLNEGPGKSLGITGRVVKLKKELVTPDVSKDDDYLGVCPSIRSEVAVPLMGEKNEVLGVLNVESKMLDAFGEDDIQALQALAQLVVTKIQSLEQYRLLKDTQMQSVSATILAWFGMASSTWGHSVAGHSLTIRDNVKLLREKLDHHINGAALRELLNDELNTIYELAEKIRQKPMIALLPSTIGVSEVGINRLIDVRVKELWRHEPYNKADKNVVLAAGEVRVRCNPNWIKQMLDILIDNALDAMAGSKPEIHISTRIVEHDEVEIAITDHGPGIPDDIKEKLFKERIENSQSKGLGTGLLMVQVIAQNYRGRVGIAKTGPEGTTMFVRFPIVKEM